MIQAGTNVRITDNSGAKFGRVFKVLGGSKRRYASIGDMVVLSVKIAEPRKQVKKKDVVYGVVVRTTKQVRRKDGSYISFDDNAVVLVDKKSKTQIEVEGIQDGMRIAIGNWLSETTGVKIIGFYLAPDNHIKNALRNRLFNDEVTDAYKLQQKDMYRGNQILADVYAKYVKILRKEKFVESNNPGYESFFIIPGVNALSVDDGEFEANTNSTTALTKAFGKYTKSRQVNRVLVNRFIGMIAV